MGLEYILVKYCFCLPLLCEDLFPLEVSCSVKRMYFTDTAALEIRSISLLTIVLHLNVRNRWNSAITQLHKFWAYFQKILVWSSTVLFPQSALT